MVRAIEDLGFDSIWLGEHLLYRWADRPAARPVGGLDAAGGHRRGHDRGSSSGRSSPARASTTRRCSPSRPRRSTRSAAGGFILGLGAGWNETEFRAFGFPFDHRVDRFEEAFTIIRTLLREGAIDFDGRFYQARDCELLPRGPRPGGPPLLIGSNGPRMLRIDAAARRRLEHAGTRTSATRRRASPRCATVVDDGVPRRRARPGGDRADRRRAGPAARRHRAASRATRRQAAIAAARRAARRPWPRGCAPTPREGIGTSSWSSTRSPCRRSRRSRRSWRSSIAADRRRRRYRDLRTGGSVRTRC